MKSSESIRNALKHIENQKSQDVRYMLKKLRQFSMTRVRARVRVRVRVRIRVRN